MMKSNVIHRHRRSILVLLARVLILAVIPLGAKAEIFARFGSLKGESVHPKFSNHVVVQSVEWGGVSPSADASSPQQPVIDEVVLTTAYDKAAPKLGERAFKGEPIPSVTIEFTRTFSDTTELRYLQYILSDVEVTAYEVTVSEQGAMVRLRLRFAKLLMEYYHRREDGSISQPVKAEYPHS